MEKPKINKERKVKDGITLEKLTNEYIQSCYEIKTNDNGDEYIINTKPVTMRGFCVYIGIVYDTLRDWELNREDCVEPIKKLKEFCHSYMEEQLLNSKRPTVGVIFALKNAWGWKDKTEQEIKVSDNNIKFQFGIDEQ